MLAKPPSDSTMFLETVTLASAGSSAGAKEINRCRPCSGHALTLEFAGLLNQEGNEPMNTKLACVLLVALTLPSAGFAQKEDPWSVRAMLPSCESVAGKLGGKSGALTYDEGRCLGIVFAALQYGSTLFPADKKICPPTTFKTGQVLTDIIVPIKLALEFASDKAAILDTPLSIATAGALIRSYPCPPR
jgi:hypothetical protein